MGKVQKTREIMGNDLTLFLKRGLPVKYNNVSVCDEAHTVILFMC